MLDTIGSPGAPWRILLGRFYGRLKRFKQLKAHSATAAYNYSDAVYKTEPAW